MFIKLYKILLKSLSKEPVDQRSNSDEGEEMKRRNEEDPEKSDHKRDNEK